MKTTVVLSCFCLCFAFGQPVDVQPSASTSEESDLVSPDKRWEYKAPSGSEDARIVKAGSNEIAVSLVDDCDIGCEHANVLWAPGSKRFAFNRGDGKERLTSVYELREGKWQELQSLGEDDAIQRRTYDIVKAQANRKRLPKKTFLHMQWSTARAISWIDPSTLTIYSSLAMRVHRQDGEDVGEGFGADVLFTLRFDEGGKWKIVKTHQMSEKEAEKYEQEIER
jgi:hypothetical protein